MNTIDQHSKALEERITLALPELRPPAGLLRRLAEVLGDEEVVLLCGDVRSLGFGTYDGQLCLVTPTRVLLATALREQGPDAAFGLEEWDRQAAPMPQVLHVLPRSETADL